MSKRKILAKGNYLALIKEDNYEYVERVNATGVAIIFAITANDEIILVEQYRKAVDARCIELPAGLINDTAVKETTLEGARRELLEETGFEASQLDFVGCFPVSSGMSANYYNIYIATQLKRISNGGGVEDENITTHVVPLKQLEQFIKKKSVNGFHIDWKIFAGAFMFQNKILNLTKNIQP